MNTVPTQPIIVATDLHLTIPPTIGQTLGLSEGQMFQVIRYQERIELLPIQPIKSLRGFLKGMDTTLIRDND
ncbi:hypothetical protein [Leptolyngbya sp. PCC 6406]|uniref:hypothetical protein n=1 Tax=Leptolyngbya sp. PCC 6406 TaxID=1173264 RepID=UPI0002ACBE14|nr:hypothetical protein [Leptolyngbya sp. PCC 6406]